jgi:two-component system, OmpR family, sensor histidine kinase KdpD
MTEKEENSGLSKGRLFKNGLKDTGIAFLCFAVGTGICFLFDYFKINELNFPIVYVLAVTLTAIFTDGFLYSSVLSLVSVLALNFFFTDPRYTFDVSDKSNLLAFALMLAVGLTVSGLTFRLKRRMDDVRRLEIEKEKLKADAEKEQAEAVLLRSVSHDLRTPLTTIRNGSQTLHDDPELPLAERQEILVEITQKSDWTIKLIENLLSLTRIDASTLKVKKREEAVEDVVSEAVRTLKAELAGRTIHYDTPAEILLVPMDPTLISQVLVNILENAIKHTSVNGNIWIKVSADDKKAYFRLSNDGPLFKDGEGAAIFEMYNGKADRGANSTAGLGLAICKLIVNAHGGQISASNRDGLACFDFDLPREGAFTPNGKNTSN